MLSDVASKGSRLDTLRVLRDDLAARMAVCESDQNYSVMARLFADTLAQIEVAEKAAPEKAGTALDELASRRKASGRPDASGQTRAPRSAK